MMRTWRTLPLVQVAAGRRDLSSHAQKVQNYLDAWVGGNPAKSKTVSPSATSQQKPRPSQGSSSSTRPLLLSGSSYLMPTLRLERNDTAESLSSRIATAMEESFATPTAVMKSMLSGKATAHGTARWRVPIVLDLGALAPDGSPHYVPPRNGFLTDAVKALEEFGISVVGITNPPTEVENEAVRDLGLPSILSKSRALDRQVDSKYRLEDVVKLVLSRASEDADVFIDQTDTMGNPQETAAIQNSPVDEPGRHDTIHKSIQKVDQSMPVQTDSEATESESHVNIPQMAIASGGTRVYYGHVRSGQQIAAEKNQSLIVIGSVSSGGEVMADRDVFVLGKLRGRALAGLCSDESVETARIFASSFDAELVCVGDTFTTVDNVKDLGLKRGEAVMVSLDANSELVFESIQLK